MQTRITIALTALLFAAVSAEDAPQSFLFNATGVLQERIFQENVGTGIAINLTDIAATDLSNAEFKRVVAIDEDQATDVTWALETLLNYAGDLSTEENRITTTDTVYRPPDPAGDLRRRAEAIEKRDRDIIRARKILADWKEATK